MIPHGQKPGGIFYKPVGITFQGSRSAHRAAPKFHLGLDAGTKLSSEVSCVARARLLCREAGCPEPATYRGRCKYHAKLAQREEWKRTPTKFTRNSGEQSRRARTVAAWRARYGDWCPGYKKAPHYATDLTAQHAHAIAQGGSPTQPLTALCRECNSRHAQDVTHNTQRC